MTSTRSRHVDAAAPRVDWPTFLAQLDWRQGEHVSLVGPTGQGKSFLGLALLPLRSYVVVLGVKPRDATLERMTKKRAEPRYRMVKEFGDHPPVVPGWPQRLMLWPKLTKMNQLGWQAGVMEDALNGVYEEGAWCVFVDELAYFVRKLKLGDELTTLWQQGRSLGVSLVGATQRPAWVPLEMYSSATHVFLFKHNDPRDLERISGIASAGDVNPKTIRETVGHLGKNQFLYVNTRTGAMLRSRVEA